MASPDLQFYATLNSLKERGVVDLNGRDFSIRAISQAYYDAIETCSGTTQATVFTDINCASSFDYKTSYSCVACRGLYADALADRLALEAETTKRAPSYTPQTPAPGVWDRDTLCRAFCSSCAVVGADRSNYVTLSTACDFKSGGKIETDMRTSLSNQIGALIAQHGTDMAASYAKMEPGQVQAKFTDTLMSTFTVQRRDELTAGVFNYQSLRIAPRSESVLVMGVRQAVSVDVIASLVTSIMSNVSIYDSASVTAAEKDVKVTDTVAQLGDLVGTVGKQIEALWKVNLEGKVIMIAIGVLVLIILGFVGFFIARGLGGAS